MKNKKYNGSTLNQKELLDQPVGLFVLFFTEMWERFSFYGMKALLVLFLTSTVLDGGWQWTRADALYLLGIYSGLVYLTPILGGYIADKWIGYQKAIALGALVMTLGHAAMAFETPLSFYLGLLLLIVGNGLFKPNISSIIGQLYKDEEKKDGGYTIFYMGINAGAFFGMLFCGYLGEKIGWSYGFGLAGVFMLLGLLQFWYGRSVFGKIGSVSTNVESITATEKATTLSLEEKKIQNDRILVIGVLAFFTIFFWVAFEQAGGSMTIFAKDYTNRMLSGDSAFAFKWINALLILLPLLLVSYVLVKLGMLTYKSILKSNIFLGSSLVIVWAIAIWLINLDFNTKSYTVEYTNINGTYSSLEVQTQEDLSPGENVFLDKKNSVELLSSIANYKPEDNNKLAKAEVNTIDDDYFNGVLWRKTPNIYLNYALDGKEMVSSLVVDETAYSKIREASKVDIVVSESVKLTTEKGNLSGIVKSTQSDGITIPASWFGILNPLFIILFAPLFSWFWKKYPSIGGSKKFAGGLVLLGLGFAFLSFGGLDIAKGASKASVSMVYLIGSYFLMTLGELCLSPVGLSYVSKLSPKHLLGRMFGFWFISSFLAHTLAGFSGGLIDEINANYSISFFFALFAVIPILAAIIIWLLSPWLQDKMHGIN